MRPELLSWLLPFYLTLLVFVFNPFSDVVFASEQDIVVNEVMYDFPGSDDGHEWVELYNSGNAPVTIIGSSGTGSWRISDGTNHTFPTSGSLTIDSKGFLVVTQNSSTFLADNAGFSGNLIESSISLNNTGTTVGLRIGTNGILWGQFAYQNSIGAAGDGYSLQRKSDGTVIAAAVTPGRPNAENPPPTATSTLTPSPTPTNTPTPSPTSKPNATAMPTPTSTPTSTSKPTTKPTSLLANKPTDENITLPPEILGQSTKSAQTPSPSIHPPQEVKTMGASENRLPQIFIGLGILLLCACGILGFKTYKDAKNNET